LAGLNKFQAIFHDQQTIKNLEKDILNVRIQTGDGCRVPLSITLAWFDPPADTVLNDLDLHVMCEGKEYFPNGKDENDNVNNVERVRI